MPTENEWLRLIYIQLTAGGTAGASINQAQVKAAIESAVNIDGLESALASLLTASITQAQVKAAIESAVNIDGLESGLASLLTASITQAQVKAAIESAVNIDGLELPIDAANSRIRTVDSWRSLLLTNASVGFNNYVTGNEWTCPDGREWLIEGGSFSFTAASPAGDRFIRLYATDGSIPFHISRAFVQLVANTTLIYSFSPTTTTGNVTGYGSINFPGVILGASQKIGYVCSGFQTGDSFSAQRIKVMQRVV